MNPKAHAHHCRPRAPECIDDLPRTLPVFPLSGVLLLPRGRLPLNIFEPRYLAMVEDVLSSHRMIGMIQPMSGCSGDAEPPLYQLGCAGRISAFAETEDGRYLITLTGVSRFVMVREVAEVHGYRQVEADWSGYANDLAGEEHGCVDRPRLLASLRTYFKTHGLSVDWSALEEAPEERLITSLAMICPFLPSEKQALLGATDLTERSNLLITLIEMAILADRDCATPRHRH